MSDDGFKPASAFDVSDEKLVAGELRALRSEMRGWFEMLILRLDRYEGRILSLEDHRTDVNERLDRHDRRLADLEAAFNGTKDKET